MVRTTKKGTFSTVGIMVFLASLCCLGNVYADDRFALVIGNSSYETDPLRNPENDARDMAQALSGLGYQIHKNEPLLDLNLQQFESELVAFSKSLSKGAVALVYYAGHGIATQGDNYLIPIDSRLKWESQLKTRAVSLRDTIDLLNSENSGGLNIVLLDACRNNPLQKRIRGSTYRGLTRIRDLSRGSFIGYAADQGQVAADGTGRNGIYTAALLNALRTSAHIPIQLLHNEVAEVVFEQTKNTIYPQFPVNDSKFIGTYCLGDCLQSSSSAAQGFFDVTTQPPEAQVCFYVDAWRCGRNSMIPLSREYPVHVSADGYQTYQGRARLDAPGEKLNIELKPVNTVSNPQVIADSSASVDELIENASASPALLQNRDTRDVPKSSNRVLLILGTIAAGLLVRSLSDGSSDTPQEDTFNLVIPPRQ